MISNLGSTRRTLPRFRQETGPVTDHRIGFRVHHADAKPPALEVVTRGSRARLRRIHFALLRSSPGS